MAGALQTNQQQMQQQEGSLLNTVNAILDSNKDGAAMDEVAGMLGNFLNSSSGGSRSERSEKADRLRGDRLGRRRGVPGG